MHDEKPRIPLDISIEKPRIPNEKPPVPIDVPNMHNIPLKNLEFPMKNLQFLLKNPSATPGALSLKTPFYWINVRSLGFRDSEPLFFGPFHNQTVFFCRFGKSP